MKITELLRQKSETQEHYIDRCYRLRCSDWRERASGKVLVFNKPWYEKPFHDQDWVDKIPVEQFEHHIRTLPTQEEQDRGRI